MMKNRTIVEWMLCAVIAISACAKETTEPTDEPKAIAFAADANTRNTPIDNDNLVSMIVFSAHTVGREFVERTESTEGSPINFMHNQGVNKSAGTWSYSPVKYWPAGANDRVSFFAYAPATVSGVTISTTNGGTPTLTYVPPSDPVAHTDLLIADKQLNRTDRDGGITFPFKHTLARIRFNVQLAAALSADDKITLSHCTLSGVLPIGTHPLDASGIWTVSGTKTSYSHSSNFKPLTVTDTVNPQRIIDNDAEIMLIPQPHNTDMKVEVEYTVTASGTDTNRLFTVAIPTTPTLWDAGGTYAYVLHIDPLNDPIVTTAP